MVNDLVVNEDEGLPLNGVLNNNIANITVTTQYGDNNVLKQTDFLSSETTQSELQGPTAEVDKNAVTTSPPDVNGSVVSLSQSAQVAAVITCLYTADAVHMLGSHRADKGSSLADVASDPQISPSSPNGSEQPLSSQDSDRSRELLHDSAMSKVLITNQNINDNEILTNANISVANVQVPETAGEIVTELSNASYPCTNPEYPVFNQNPSVYPNPSSLTIHNKDYDEAMNDKKLKAGKKNRKGNESGVTSAMTTRSQAALFN